MIHELYPELKTGKRHSHNKTLSRACPPNYSLYPKHKGRDIIKCYPQFLNKIQGVYPLVPLWCKQGIGKSILRQLYTGKNNFILLGKNRGCFL